MMSRLLHEITASLLVVILTHRYIVYEINIPEHIKDSLQFCCLVNHLHSLNPKI